MPNKTKYHDIILKRSLDVEISFGFNIPKKSSPNAGVL